MSPIILFKERYLKMEYFHAERAFIIGVKPALMSNDRHEKIEFLKENYPYYTLQERPNFNEYLFFQKKDLMDRFLEEVNGKPIPKNPDHTQALGIALGYPPKAVKHFINKRFSNDPEVSLKDLGLHYCGIHCAGSVDSLVNDVTWLWAKYPYPELDKLSICYEQGHLKQECTLDYQDTQSLEFFQQILRMTIQLTYQYIPNPALVG